MVDHPQTTSQMCHAHACRLDHRVVNLGAEALGGHCNEADPYNHLVEDHHSHFAGDNQEDYLDHLDLANVRHSPEKEEEEEEAGCDAGVAQPRRRPCNRLDSLCLSP